MNSLAQKFFTIGKDCPFRDVRFLIEEPELNWEEVSQIAPTLAKGWFELSRLCARDRIDFTRDFWLDRLPYHPVGHPAIFEFFERLDDVAPILVSRREIGPMEPELVYSFSDNSSFFRGKPSCAGEALQELQSALEVSLPRDFLSFTQIHDGFGKLSEMGLLNVGEISNAKRRVIALLLGTDIRVKSGDQDVDPGALIPFYESLGLSSFQCFYTDWYPSNEMGNVYLSGIDYTLSDVRDKKSWDENLAFPTFSEWLIYYLQGMDLCI